MLHSSTLQGSGWAWLGLNPADKSLVIATTPNQDILDKQVCATAPFCAGGSRVNSLSNLSANIADVCLAALQDAKDISSNFRTLSCRA